MGSHELDCPPSEDSTRLEGDFHRSEFPKGFVFGSATAAYQVEGAFNEGGRGPSVWDIFSHTPGKTADGDNGDVAVDQYHRYEEDIDNLKSMHMDAYRFSISWSRLIPDGRGPELNEEGVAYYNRLIDYALSKGVQPYVTLYHWDLPQALQDSMGGWPCREIVKHFTFYAEACFAAFGDRVVNWITFNEPQQFSWFGYGSGIHAPGRTSDRSWSPAGDTSTEPYLSAHNVLLAHAATVDIYRKKFQAAQGGTIGITLDCEWAEPLTDSPEDVAAAKRRVLFQIGWFLDPIFFGDYPQVMRERIGARLPTFSAAEISLLKNSTDFIGLNHYTTKYVSACPPPNDLAAAGFWQDQCMTTAAIRDEAPIGPRAYSFWLYMVPWGFERLMLWVWNRYKTPLYITENGIVYRHSKFPGLDSAMYGLTGVGEIGGMDTKNCQHLGQSVPSESINDTERIKYFQDYLKVILSVLRQGVDVRCYFAWSLVDNFEWALGYRSRFGLYYVDYFTLERHPKDSVGWFTKFLGPRIENSRPTKEL